ncbi:hypothetical protein B0H12DRAFT_1232979 [Mycena haematopus]|nr:hypothetical protein B0H12DRAFT_1232979 [Mycena haematopus]
MVFYRVLVTSNEIDALPLSLTATATFSPSIVLERSSSVGSNSSSYVDSATISPTSTSSQSFATGVSSKSSAITTGTVLGIVVATMALLVLLVIAFISYIFRRRRAAAASMAHPSDADEAEKLLDQRGPPQLPPIPISASSSRDSKSSAYLSSSLEQLPVPQNSIASDSGSGTFSEVNSFESIPPTPPKSPPPSVHRAKPKEQPQPRVMWAGTQSSGSTVSGATSNTSSSERTAQQYAPSATSTIVRSPLQFRHTASDLASPLSPPAPVAPW